MRRLPLVLLALVLVHLPLSAADPDTRARNFDRAQKITQKGERALQSGNASRARGHFEEALALAPGFAPARMGLGHVLMSERRFEEALDGYRGALESFGEMGDYLQQREMDRYAASRERVEQLRDELIHLDNLLANARTEREQQNIQIRIARVDNSIQELSATELPTPDLTREPPAEIHFFIGNALSNLGRDEEAVASWLRCAEKRTDFAPVYNNLAVGLWKLGRPGEALSRLEQAEGLGLEVNPNLKRDLASAVEASGGDDAPGG